MAIADENIGKYDLVEKVGTGRVRVSRNGPILARINDGTVQNNSSGRVMTML
jgi:hypothetical protein